MSSSPLALLRWLLWRRWARERLRVLLTVLGVALGVSVFVAIRLASRSAMASFSDTVDAVSGRANLQVSAVADGFDERRTRLLELLGSLRRPRDLARLPPNDLASSPLAAELTGLGAFRADVTGAGPAVYGLFQSRESAEAARSRIRSRGRAWLTVPAWYF